MFFLLRTLRTMNAVHEFFGQPSYNDNSCKIFKNAFHCDKNRSYSDYIWEFPLKQIIQNATTLHEHIQYVCQHTFNCLKHLDCVNRFLKTHKINFYLHYIHTTYINVKNNFYFKWLTYKTFSHKATMKCLYI
jgi:hypothetical protein